MRRGSRIATSAAAAGVIIAGAGAAIAAVPHSAHETNPVTPASTPSATTDAAYLAQLQKAGEADADQVAALRRAIAKAQASIAAEQQRLEDAQRAAARAAQAEQSNARSNTTGTGSYHDSTDPSAPPSVAATTGASGASGEHEDDDGVEVEHEDSPGDEPGDD